MYTALLALHNIIRWLVLGAGLNIVFKSALGKRSKKEWSKSETTAQKLFIIFMDIQFTLGILLYGIFSPITKAAFANMGAAMKDPALRFYAVEHITLMVVALALAHIGSAKVKKSDSDESKFKYAVVFFTISLFLIILGMPFKARLLPF